MEWISQFVVYRIDTDCSLIEVYHTDDIKSAKYWMQYIAEPGDLLCKTPLHPRHSKASKRAEYWSHKARDNSLCREEDDWNDLASRRNFDFVFPAEQLSEPE